MSKQNQTGYNGEFIIFFQDTLNAKITIDILRMRNDKRVAISELRVRFLNAGHPKYEIEENTLITISFDHGNEPFYKFTIEDVKLIKDQKGEILWESPSD